MTRHHDVGDDALPLSAEDKRELCKRILSRSKISPRASQARHVIPFLFEAEIDGRVPSGKEIAEHMAIESPGHKRKSGTEKPNVAAQEIKRIRKYLDAYFASNRDEPVRALIATNQYGLTFVANTPTPPERNYVRDFWAPHLSVEGAVTIIYTEPLFTRDKEFTKFLRRVDVNSDSNPSDDEEFCYSHVPLGEVVATLKLAKRFWEWGRATTEYGGRRDVPYDSIIRTSPNNSFVVLGAPRANGFIWSLQRDARLDIFVSEYDIVIKNPGPGEEPSYKESQTDDSVLGYVVVTGLKKMGCTVTMLHGNHGQAISQLAQILLDEERLRSLYATHLPELLSGGLPERYQFLFSVEIDHRGESVAEEVRLLARRPDPWPDECIATSKDH